MARISRVSYNKRPEGPPGLLLTKDYAMDLLNLAKAARANAHAKYSGFKVGAALRTMTGKTYSGCNVENASYPEGTCAEAGAISAMVADGERNIAEILIFADAPKPISPCGGCRQRIAEFSQADTKVTMATTQGAIETTTIAALLPNAFDETFLG
ncbi:MAG: cytidine deaminase [Henriciella sp.]|nr:cytidine deaminase [Henriciella sp.]